MTSVAILIPVLDRPHRVAPLLESIQAARPDPRYRIKVRPVFICSPTDPAQITAVRAAGQEPLVTGWEPGPGDYARKLNLAVTEASEDFVFLAADDLVFHSGWLENALQKQRATHACVIGTNDLGNRAVMSGIHSTHTLVAREYAECGTIDEPDSGKILHEGYDHNWVDNEFIETAKWRQTLAFAPKAIIEHLHPDWGKAEWDNTYLKGRKRFSEDRQLFQRRRKLWGDRRYR